jgi:CDP-diacylglycerol--glycerol-3-phosphate 3-phosphatidyltransferase
MHDSKLNDFLALFFLFLSGVSDYLDGYFARKLDIQSEFGRMLDPVIDKIIVGVVMLFLAAYRGLPYGYVIAVLSRDILILIASVYLLSRTKTISESNLLGKWTLFSYLLVIAAFIIDLGVFKYIIMWISAILIPFSFVKYLLLFWKFLREHI